MLGFVGGVRLDGQDKIALVDDGWLEFASRSLGLDVTPSAVLGRPFSEFAPDRELGALYSLVFRRVRATAKPMRIPYRSEIVGERWHMDIEVLPLAGGHVDCRYICVLVEALGPASTSAARPERLLTRCAWCRDVKLPEGKWAGIDALAERLDLFIGEATRISHGMCPACEAGVRATIKFAR